MICDTCLDIRSVNSRRFDKEVMMGKELRGEIGGCCVEIIKTILFGETEKNRNRN